MRTIGWNRVEEFGAELARVDDGDGLRATGWTLGAAPVAYHAAYTLATDSRWRTTSLEVTTEGAGWSRKLVLSNDPDRRAGWRVRASESGALVGPPPGAELPELFEDALDLDLGFSPLTNTLPIRRLGLLDGAGSTEQKITVAFVELPSLAVVASVQYYSRLPEGRVLFRDDSGYRAELDIDEAGYVVHYPGLAQRH
jgi:hypothetical protein